MQDVQTQNNRQTDTDPFSNYLHYIDTRKRDRLILEGGGVVRAICGEDIPVHPGNLDAAVAAGSYKKLSVCAMCAMEYESMPPGC